MIKKFYQFIKEHESIQFMPYPSKEDIEDQFLRLKEVIGCNINIRCFVGRVIKNKNNHWNIRSENHPGRQIAWIDFSLTKENNGGEYLSNKKIKEISLELESIKNRMESMYPVKVNTSDFSRPSSRHSDTSFRITSDFSKPSNRHSDTSFRIKIIMNV